MKKLLLLAAMAVFFMSGAQAQKCDPSYKEFQLTEKGDSIFHSPLSGTVGFTKLKGNGREIYVMTVEVPGSTAVDDGVGMVLFLDGSEPIKYPDAEVEYKFKNERHTYHVTQLLDEYQILEFMLYPIVSVKLYIFQKDLPKKERELYQTYAQCVFGAK